MKSLALAALAGLAAILAPKSAHAVECDQLTTGLRICLPRQGTDFDQWSTADINALTLINSSGSYNSTGAIHTADWLQVRRISGVSTAPASGIRLSSAVYQDEGFYFTTRSSASFLGPQVGVLYGVSAATGAFGTTVVPSSAALMVAGNVSVNGRVESSSWTVSGSGHSGIEYASSGDGVVNLNSKGGVYVNVDADNDDSAFFRVYKNARSGNGTEQFEVDQNGNAEAAGDLTAIDDIFAQSNLVAGSVNPACSTCTLHVHGSAAVSGTMQAATVKFNDGTTMTTASSASSFTVGFDSSTTLGSLSFPGVGATANNVCVARSSLTVTGHGCAVQIIFNAPVSECNSNQNMSTNFLLNGAFVTGFSPGTDPGRHNCAGTGAAANAGFDVKIPAQSAGTLNFCAIAYSSVGNFESTTTRPQFRVVELCNISN